MPVTRKDIAKELNISDSLVGKVLNGSPNVWASPELCERIRHTARARGYRPNGAAQALAKGRSNLVAVWSIHLDFYARHVTRLQALAQADGYEVLVRQVEYAPADWKWPADGIICIDAPDRIREYRRSNHGATVPMVNMGVQQCPEVDQVIIDLVSGTSEALGEMARRGCRRIAYLLSGNGLSYVDEGRMQAYNKLMHEMGTERELIVAKDMSAAAAHDAMRSHIQQHGLPDGLLVMVSEMVPGALTALAAASARVPGDVALATIDDTSELAFLSPPITAIEVPIEQATAAAWRLLRNRLKNPDSPLQHETLSTRLVSRESTTGHGFVKAGQS